MQQDDSEVWYIKDVPQSLDEALAKIEWFDDEDTVTLDGDPIGIGATDTPLPDSYQSLRQHVSSVSPVPDAIHGRRAQIVSFAYGNLAVEHPDITRESVWAALETIESEREQ